MMWKTLIFLAVVSVVLAGRIKKHSSSYEFHVKHDYDYGRREKLQHQHHVDKEEAKHDEEKEEDKELNENQSNDEQPEAQEQEEEKKDEEQEIKEEEPANTETQKPDNYEEYQYPAYEFLYKVEDHHTHDTKGQHEKRYGDEVKGAYWLLQPDGYKRTVEYHANKHDGFLAKVDYSKPKENDEEQHEPEQKSEHHLKIYHDYNKEKSEKHEKDIPPKSEYYVTTYNGHKKYIPIKEEVDEQQEEQQEEQGTQEDSAQHIPIYVI